MEPLTATIIVVLGKYALDKGLELGKEVGPKALETAKEMFTTVLDRLRKDPTGKVVADQYEKNRSQSPSRNNWTFNSSWRSTCLRLAARYSLRWRPATPFTSFKPFSS